MNVRNGILIENPSHRRKASKTVEGKRIKKPITGPVKMIEMYMVMDCGNEASVIMPYRNKWVMQYINEGWKIRERWTTK